MPTYKKKDFTSDQDVRWCPGCGDYAILASVQLAMTKIGKKKEDIVFVSGIGCSSRFPYYMDTYGLHTIHGRAPAVASGVKVQNPDLSVWLITGDGDGLSIGGNHTIHLVRRNLDINVILFNNEIYGLTKGQYSPTTRVGMKTKSTPYGSIDRPFHPASLVIGANSTFFARTIDTDPKHMQEVFLKASQHKGTSFVEVLQNCVIFNDKTHDPVTNRATRPDNSINLEHGKPMIFGKENNKGIVFDGFTPKIVTIGENGITEKDLAVHNENEPSGVWSYMLSTMSYPDMPVPLGVLRCVDAAVYESAVHEQIDNAKSKFGEGSMEKLLHSGDTWTIK